MNEPYLHYDHIETERLNSDGPQAVVYATGERASLPSDDLNLGEYTDDVLRGGHAVAFVGTGLSIVDVDTRSRLATYARNPVTERFLVVNSPEDKGLSIVRIAAMGDFEVKTIPEGRAVIIGRTAESLFDIDDEHVSREHFELEAGRSGLVKRNALTVRNRTGQRGGTLVSTNYSKRGY